MLIVLLLELGCRKLPLFVVEVRASLGIDSRIVVADHTVVVPCCCVTPLQTLIVFGHVEAFGRRERDASHASPNWDSK